MISCALSVALAQSATEVGIPLRLTRTEQVVKALEAVPLEALSCPAGCGADQMFRFEVCPSCGLAMRAADLSKDFKPSVSLEGVSAIFSFQGSFDGLVVLRRSKIDAALSELGMERNESGLIVHGPFQIHFKDAELGVQIDALRAIRGIESVEVDGKIAYVKADRADWNEILLALKDKPIEDLSWVVNFKAGRIGFEIVFD